MLLVNTKVNQQVESAMVMHLKKIKYWNIEVLHGYDLFLAKNWLFYDNFEENSCKKSHIL